MRNRRILRRIRECLHTNSRPSVWTYISKVNKIPDFVWAIKTLLMHLHSCLNTFCKALGVINTNVRGYHIQDHQNHFNKVDLYIFICCIYFLYIFFVYTLYMLYIFFGIYLYIVYIFFILIYIFFQLLCFVTNDMIM